MGRFIRKLLSYIPTSLPVGMTEFVEWSDSIIELSGKFADEDSMRWAISNMIMHLPSTKATASKNYFVQCLRKTAANQIAGQIFVDIKEKQAAAQKAAEAAQQPQQAEATAAPVASNETKA